MALNVYPAARQALGFRANINGAGGQFFLTAAGERPVQRLYARVNALCSE